MDCLLGSRQKTSVQQLLGGKKRPKDPFPPLGKAQERKQVRSSRALFGDCFVEKLTTEDWPGPVLASLNMSGKGNDGQSRDRAARNLSVGQTREREKMIIAGW